MPRSFFKPSSMSRAGSGFLALLLVLPCFAFGEQIDIQGPPGSGLFGWRVAVLQNGNIVVTDPYYSTSNASEIGAIHLFDPTGNPISRLTGSQARDRVGHGRIVVLANGHFVVSSLAWDNGSAVNAGAVTWINADSGLWGEVSPQNSLVGASDSDQVGGYTDVLALPNGHYVVSSSSWSNAGAINAGAVTWGDGNGGTVGAISAGNSLVGTEAMDSVGQNQNLFGDNIVALPNGHYVVTSWYWHNATRKNFGAVTWGNGQGGTVGPISAQNSLLGTTDCSSDTGNSGQITVLANSNYLVASPCWSNQGVGDAGAVTWVDGSLPTAGEVSAANSLVGTLDLDRVGVFGAIALVNGNYVIRSGHWHSGIGAATWGDGTTGKPTGWVSASNSLVGSISGDFVGSRATALANGHYVVGSWSWSSPSASNVGAVAWGNGATGLSGTLSARNSLIGSTFNDAIGFRSITALPNGSYVVASPSWSDGPLSGVGAVTLVDGSGPVSGTVSVGNSLIGSHAGDYIGDRGIRVLPSGGFVITSPYWSTDAASRVGAVTWEDGLAPLSGKVSPENSLVGENPDDQVGSGGIAVLGNGNYVVASSGWNLGSIPDVGAATWVDGTQGRFGAVSSANSLVGSTAQDRIGSAINVLADGNYLIFGSAGPTDSLTVADGSHSSTGQLQSWNTLYADTGQGSYDQNTAYDPSRGQLVLGRASENIVTLFSVDDTLFVSGFE